jgi:hypothetical protein
MKHLRLVVALSAANVVLLVFLLLQSFAPARRGRRRHPARPRFADRRRPRARARELSAA